ncbi:hypothetical protein DFH11DRAFT_1510962, partial [Phellopilus nigrolimitatus]
MYGRSHGDGGDTSSSSDGRFYDDPHSDAWAAQAPAFGHWSPRSARRRREHYASRGDGYSDYYSYEHDAPPSSSQSGYSEYYSAASEPYDEPAFYEAGYHDRSAYRHDYQQQRSYSTYLAGPAFSPRYRRTPTPSPPPAPLPSSPSPDYIQVASLPSSPSPSAPRKLVILDLNGTLLVRNARGVPHPRPYMPALRDFLFAPRTRAWLDAMVWSSAQPHNVDRMVRRCFFDALLGAPAAGTVACDANDGFVAVWARDTLGLSHGDYSKKTQTTKDLAKPWAALASSAPSTSSANAPTSASSSEPLREPHSAYTTFLLDDSPAKARLQPYSHVCIREYAEQAREHDVRLKVRALFAQVEIKPEPAQVEEVDGESLAELHDADAIKEKEVGKTGEGEGTAALDQTLLAVVGILAALRQESNVAGWIRAGGL